MTLPVHLVDSLKRVAKGDVVTVDGDEGHHAVVVRRLKVGEAVMLTDGHGMCATGVIAETTKKKMTVKVREIVREDPPRPEVTVVQALPKGDRGELAVEVLTEIGVSTIVPWAAARSVATWRGDRAAKSHRKWQATAREAAKQARRAWHPSVALLASTDHVVDLVRNADLAVVLHEEASTALPKPGKAETIVVIVGPEGGLTPDEVAAFNVAGAHSARMGNEVLRTSTAGLAATAALLSRTPRWKPSS